jgi:hypothetical protein
MKMMPRLNDRGEDAMSERMFEPHPAPIPWACWTALREYWKTPQSFEDYMTLHQRWIELNGEACISLYDTFLSTAPKNYFEN